MFHGLIYILTRSKVGPDLQWRRNFVNI